MDESKKQKIQTSETFLLSAILAISGGFQYSGKRVRLFFSLFRI